MALAGILAMEPKFLVLDEPTAGLDPQGVEEMLQLFYNLYEKGITIIIVTHDLDNALR
ncbi:ABC transporter ATP-binding protein [Chlamydia trachomatis]|nr:ABC transporter ATP-binding protein [Chlamydia trachomatis]